MAKDTQKIKKGIADLRDLPDPLYDELWERIIVPSKVKDRLLAQMTMEFNIRKNFDFSQIPLHGIVFLAGPPGTGKTSLAKGLASHTARSFPGEKFRFLQVDPHDLEASSLGRTQYEIRTLLYETVADLARETPLIVLLDEVETLAISRGKLSLEHNSIDIHRGTDAVLTGVDHLAKTFHNILFIATSNFEEAIDDAFLSRVDIVQRLDKPDLEACEIIIADMLAVMAKKWPRLKDLLNDDEFPYLKHDASGLDGRQIRKAVIQAFTTSHDLAKNPENLTCKLLSSELHRIKQIEKLKNVRK